MADMTSLSKEELLLLVTQQQEMIALLLKQIEELKAEIERLKGGGKTKTPPPDWVKANTKKPEPPPQKTPRKQRKHSFVRLREAPTEEVVHACSECPDCGRTLTGGSVSLPRNNVPGVKQVVRVEYTL